MYNPKSGADMGRRIRFEWSYQKLVGSCATIISVPTRVQVDTDADGRHTPDWVVLQMEYSSVFGYAPSGLRALVRNGKTKLCFPHLVGTECPGLTSGKVRRGVRNPPRDGLEST